MFSSTTTSQWRDKWCVADLPLPWLSLPMTRSGLQANSFVEDYPDFVTIQKEEGTSAMLWEMLGFCIDMVMDIIYTTLW